MQWTTNGITVINDVRKAILKKKVILNIIIDSYAWYDRIFRYVHITFAMTSPLISFLDQMINGSVNYTSTATLVIGSIVAGMIKLKDYLKFDKMKDQSKQQTVKYQQLYQRIDREMRKPEASRQNEEEFISWISRELSIIEVDDPDLPQSLKLKYIELCKAKGIPYDEDLDALTELFSVVVVAVADEAIEDNEIKVGTTIEAKPADEKLNDEKPTELTITMPPIEKPIDEKPINDKPQEPTTDIPIEDPQQIRYNTVYRHRSESEETKRREYKKQVATLNTGKDLEWVMERIESID